MRALRPALAAAAAILLAGCASVPPATEGEAPVAPPPGEAQAAATPAPTVPEEPAAPAVPAPPPAPKGKPWHVSYTAGSQLAKADGVLVYLGLPAATDRKTRRAGPSELDRKSTVAPLLQARNRPLVSGRPLRVCLDPGHGGQDAGACSADGRTAEKTIALDIAQRVARMLRKDGVDVFLTRPDDRTFLPLPDRPAFARAKTADLFVSVHLNANASAAARGAETYVFPARGMESTSFDASRGASDESKQWWPGNGNDWGNVQLGFCIQRRLVAASGLPDRGLRRARFVVVREARMPAALVECGFLTNSRDLAVLRSESGREKIARGIYEGIFDFAWGTMEPGLPAHVPGPPVVSVAPPAAPASAPEAAGAAPREAVEFVPTPFAPWTPPPRTAPAVPAPAPGEDPATAAAREAALRAAGLLD